MNSSSSSSSSSSPSSSSEEEGTKNVKKPPPNDDAGSSVRDASATTTLSSSKHLPRATTTTTAGPKKKRAPRRPTKPTKIRQSDPAYLHQLSDSLEHVIVVGKKVSRDSWRRKVAQSKLKGTNGSSGCGDGADDTSVAATAATATTTPQKNEAPDENGGEDGDDLRDNNNQTKNNKKRKKIFHAEDFRIYETFNHEILEKMQNKRLRRDGTGVAVESVDEQWQIEHGDGIVHNSFSTTRLSQRPPPQPSSQDPLHFHPNHSTNIAYPQHLFGFDESPKRTRLEDVPRELLLKCWERAVHAASNAIHAPMATTTTTTVGAAKNDDQIMFNTTTLLRRDDVEQRCTTLGIDLRSFLNQLDTSQTNFNDITTSTPATTCPRCSRVLSSVSACEDHYYGDENNIGCCRPTLREKQLELIKRILLTKVQSQTEGLWGVLVSQYRQINTTQDQAGNGSQSKKSKGPIIDWIKVQDLLQQSVSDSTSLHKAVEKSIGADGVDMGSDTEDQQDSSLSLERSTRKTTHQVLECLNYKNGSSNGNDGDDTSELMLNPMVLEAVYRRLVDRYADVPP